MLLEHRPVVHFVDVVGGEDQHLVGRLGENALRILKNCVGRAEIPALAGSASWLDDFDVLTQFGRENAPPSRI
jgi:hypothetical protein